MKQKQFQKLKGGRMMSQLFLRMFMLLALVLGSVNGVWGQTSYGKAEISSAPGSATDWQTITDQGNVKAWYKGTSGNEGTNGGAQIDNKWFVKLSSEGFIKIRVAKGTVVAGDILRVEMAHFYDNSDAATLGFQVVGSNGTVSKTNVTDRNVYSLDYTLKASDINLDTDATDYDYIQINRNQNSGCAYHSVEILRYDHYTVTWNGTEVPTGCEAWYTIGDDQTKIKETKAVVAGTSVTFHGTDSGNDSKMILGWHNPSNNPSSYWGYGATMTVTVNSDISVKPDFQNCFRVFANAENGATATVNTSGKHFQKVENLSFSTTVPDGYTFDGWYNGSSRLSGGNPYNYGKYQPDDGVTDLTLTAKFKSNTPAANTIQKPDCGGVNIDLTKLNAGTATLSVSDGKGTVTTGSNNGYISIKFDQAYSFTDLKKYTVGGNDVKNNLNNVQFLKDGVGIEGADYYSDVNDKTLTDDHRSKLTSADEIRFHFKANTTTTIDYIYFEVAHGPRTKPTLASPTATEMKIFSDETLQLRITNTAGFWREYTDATYKTETTAHGVGVNAKGETDWKPSYDLTGLTPGDYYFGIKDGGNCTEYDKYHESELVTVHVKVIAPIASIDVNGTKRYYDVYAPAGITSSESSKVGVVISLHGASNDYDNGRVDFNGIADAEKETAKKFVVVYPRGLMRQLRGTERGWESYTESNTEDVEFFKAIVKDINDKDNGLTVDMSRIYLAGFSNGGMMAYKAAHQAGDFFAAFASVGGYPVNESHLFHAGSQPTPFIHIQGKADTVFPDGTYPLNVVAHNMMYRNGASFTPAGDGNGVINPHLANVEEDCHQAEEGGAAFYMYKVQGMGHVPSYSWDGVEGDDVASTMWAFFNKESIANKVDTTLKFRINAPGVFWDVASTGKTGSVEVGYIGFDNVNTGTSVLSYGGYTKTDDKTSTFNKDSNNKNLWHSLQFNGGINGAPHYLKLNVYTEKVSTEDETQYFLIKLTKTGASTPVFAKRYQAGRGQKDLYINFSALPGFNEYKLEITKSSAELVVKVNDVEFHTGRCEDLGLDSEGHQITENPVFFQDVATVLAGMKPIYQPIYGKSYNGIAKEYLPIAEIPVGEIAVGSSNRPSDIPDTDKEGKAYIYKVIEDKLKNSDAQNATVMGSLPSTVITDWAGQTTAKIKGNKLFNLAVSGKDGEDTGVKSNNAFILIPSTEEYTIDKVKGINISEHGRAEMPEYLNGTRGAFPTHGVIAIKLQGTLDFYLLAQNEITYAGTNPNPARRTLKVYYTNDQLDGELKELKEWWFFGTRSENDFSDLQGNSLSALSANIRLPQLGKDGTCTVFITYEGDGQGQSFTHASTDKDKIWIKGFVIKRPDLKVTIGRTDNKYKDQKYNGQNNTFCTRFGENKPYIWSFENVGFSNTKYANLEDKKLNEYDGRTYVCGGTDDSMDHLLLFSDPTVVRDEEGNLTNTDDKVQFDGRVPGQEHIEFLKASNYKMDDGNVYNRKIWDPIPSNGLKVNVTGSGWFKIKCSAPNGPVKMKVYSSTNYGTSYINLLREFVVDNTKHPASATGEDEHKWGEYTVYLKGHVNRNGNAGFWDGEYDNSYDEGAEEILRMSLYVVFDEIETSKPYTEGHPQLNIHELSWLNEEPADYVFQREEDPKLLTEWQEIKRNDETVLWWKAGNDTDNGYTMLKENGQNAYNRLGQMTTNIADGKGVKSPGGYASTSVPSDAGKYEAYWDIAAPATTNAHTEKAYADGNKTLTEESPEYENAYKSGKPNTEFDMPISGSFVRICAMQNTYVVAHVLPGTAGKAVYVLDETGAQIPYSNGNEDNKKRLGYVVSTALTNVGADLNNGKTSQDGTVRIDFTVNAGKEYFICADGASISLARLEVHDWRYKPTKSSTKLALTGGEDNSENIGAQYDTKDFYRDASLAGRTLTPGKWTSIVLPFSLNEKKFEQVFGTGAKCLHFTDVSIPNKTIYLTHHYYNMIVAGRPVFVRPGSDFNNDNLKNITDVTLQAKEVINHPATNGFQFVASYDNDATMKKNDLFMNDNNAIQFLNVASATYPGMRSYIKNNSGYDFNANVHNTKALFLNFDDEVEEATGIDELIAEEFGEDVIVVTKSTKVYDLNGRMVAEGKDINSLPAGIYIVNGKKYIVK